MKGVFKCFSVSFYGFFLSVFLIFLLSCAHVQSSYPQHWWHEIHDSNTPHWEILPQSAQFPEVILSKRNELGLLSNFAHTPFQFKKKKYQSVEGFWQATKFPENENDPRYKLTQWPWTREEVEQMVGFEAKKAGDFASEVMKKNNINWVSFQGNRMVYREEGESSFYLLIYQVMLEKVRQNPEVRKLLLSTRGLKLKPDHFQDSSLPKAWHYAEIYSAIREEL